MRSTYLLHHDILLDGQYHIEFILLDVGEITQQVVTQLPLVRALEQVLLLCLEGFLEHGLREKKRNS